MWWSNYCFEGSQFAQNSIEDKQFLGLGLLITGYSDHLQRMTILSVLPRFHFDLEIQQFILKLPSPLALNIYIIIEMTDSNNLNPLDLEKSTSRRSRKDEEGRDFQCGCGKRYLSYPALYTHIKTKHNGQQPEGTQKTSTTVIPKKIKSKQQQQLKGLTNHLQKEDIKLLSQLDQQMLGSVPLHYRFRKDHISKEIYQNYLILTRNPEITFQKTSTLDLLLALYLYNVGEYVNQKLYDHYLLFSKILRNCFFEHAQEVYQACFSKSDSPSFLSTFTNGEVQYVPIICDYMLRYYIPHLESTKQSKDVNLSLMELMLSDFCTWLFKKKLSPIKITLKKQYKLQTKPVPLVRHRSHNHKNQNKDKEASVSDSKKDHSFPSSDEVSEEMEEEEEENSSNEEIDQEVEEEKDKPEKINSKASEKEKRQEKPEKIDEALQVSNSILSEENKKLNQLVKNVSSPQKHQAIPREFNPIQTIPQLSPKPGQSSSEPIKPQGPVNTPASQKK